MPHRVRVLATALPLITLPHRLGATRTPKLPQSPVLGLSGSVHYTLAPLCLPFRPPVTLLPGRIRTERLAPVLTNPTSSGNLPLKCPQPLVLRKPLPNLVIILPSPPFPTLLLVMTSLPLGILETL